MEETSSTFENNLVMAMFGFKAYFWDDQVYINDRAYKTNEILTACLNVRETEESLTGHLRELERLLPRVQILDDDYDTERHYNENVQRAQQLLFYIGGILRQLPPYDSCLFSVALEQPHLFDCLNESYHGWKTGDYKYDADFSNEFGYVVKSGADSHRMYVQSFHPEPWDVIHCGEDETIFSELNEGVEKLFGRFTGMLKDLIRAKTAYAEFLDNYIHDESKFLGDSAVARRFAAYTQSVAHRRDYQRLIASSAMQMSHEVYRREDGREKLCEVYTFDSLGAFLYFDFFRGLTRSYLPKRCDNCGRYFLLEAGKYSSYCARPLEDDPDKTCRDIGARKKYDDKCKSDPVWLAYNRAYKAHYARYMKKKMTVAEFEQRSRQAVEWRTQAEMGTLAQAEYERILKQ